MGLSDSGTPGTVSYSRSNEHVLDTILNTLRGPGDHPSLWLHHWFNLLLTASFLGHIFINKNKEYIFGASQILYYALTTLSKLQTLGEEYTTIVQVGRTGRHVPGFLVSKWTREQWNKRICSRNTILSFTAKHLHGIGPCVRRPTHLSSPESFYRLCSNKPNDHTSSQRSNRSHRDDC